MKRTAAGFTLLEVLVAFTIMALTLGGLMQIFSTGLRGTAQAREHAQAAFVAQSLLDTADVNRLLKSGRQVGATGPYVWQVEAVPLREPAADEDEATGDALQTRPVIVRVAVHWGTDNPAVTLTTLRIWQADAVSDNQQ